MSRKKNSFQSQINPLLTKLFRSSWLDIGLLLFLRVYGPRLHKHAKKELGQYPAILTSHLVENPYFCPVIYLFRLNAQRYHKSYRCGPFEWPSSTLVRSLPPPPLSHISFSIMPFCWGKILYDSLVHKQLVYARISDPKRNVKKKKKKRLKDSCRFQSTA